MKKLLKRILTVTLSIMMILAAIPVQAAAPSYLTKSKTITLYTGKTARLMMYQKTWLGFFASGVDKVKSVKNSNPSVAEVSAEYGSIYAAPKKTGKTVITATDGKITKKCTLKVKKYENPVASVKVGNKTVPGSKFDADAYRVLNYSQFANKRKKITFNLKKGWSVQEVYYAQSGWMKSEDMQNGEIIKIKGGKGFQVGAVVVNDKTGQREDLLLWFK